MLRNQCSVDLKLPVKPFRSREVALWREKFQKKPAPQGLALWIGCERCSERWRLLDWIHRIRAEILHHSIVPCQARVVYIGPCDCFSCELSDTSSFFLLIPSGGNESLQGSLRD